jgi:hypothetical protein
MIKPSVQRSRIDHISHRKLTDAAESLKDASIDNPGFFLGQANKAVNRVTDFLESGHFTTDLSLRDPPCEANRTDSHSLKRWIFYRTSSTHFASSRMQSASLDHLRM